MDDWTRLPVRVAIHDALVLPSGQVPPGRRAWDLARGGTAALGRSLPTLLKAGLQIGSVAVVGLLGYLLLAEVRSTRIEIVPFSAPEALPRQGFSPEIVARRLLDQIVALQTSARTSMARTETGLASEATDFVLPGVGLSLRTIVQAVRRMLGVPSPRVAGEIVLASGVYSLRLRIVGEAPLVDVGDDAPEAIDALLRHGARAILLRIEPYIVASSDFVGGQDPRAVLALLDRIIDESAPNSDVHARAVNLQGLIYAEKLRNPARAEEHLGARIAPDRSWR